MSLKIKFSTIGDKIAYKNQQRKLAQKAANEKQLKAITSKIAHEMFPNKPVTLTVNSEELGSRTMTSVVDDYMARISFENSIWAPWSKSYKK